jgi:chromosomal replication initiator protein
MTSAAEITGRRASFSWVPPRFVVLPETRSAVLAVRCLARCLERRRRPFGPLVLYGPPGSGKSHLVNALHEFARTRHDSHRLEASAWPRWDDDAPPEEWRLCDLLVIEDLQHLPVWAADKFASVLDDRCSRQLPTVVTAIRGLADLDNVSARLANRLRSGLLVRLDLPDARGRRRILSRLFSRGRLTVCDEILDWLAANTPGSGRALRAAVTRVEHLAAGLPHPPDFDTVRSAIQPDAAVHRPGMERIVTLVAARFGVEERQLRGLARHPGIVWPRQLSMHLARYALKLPLSRIGEYFGRDHTTVRHACAKINRELADDAELRGVIRELTAEIADPTLGLGKTRH